MHRGQHFLQDLCQVDSALVCYTIVSNRVTDKSLSRDSVYLVALAFNNLGYIYGAYYFDYEKAYESLNRSLEISEQYGFEVNKAYAYMNLASLMDSRDELFGEETLSSEALDNTKLAFNQAVKVKEWNVAVTNVYNMLTMVDRKSGIRPIKPELDRFKQLPLDQSVEMWQSTLMFCQGVEAFLAGQYSQALAFYKQMALQAEHLTTNRQQCIIMARMKQAEVLAALHRYTEAIACLEQNVADAQSQGLDTDLINTYQEMIRVYEAMGDKQKANEFEYIYLKTRDKFIHKSHAERLEKSRFLEEMRRVNEQVEQIQAKHERAHQLLLMMSLIAAVILVALVLLMRSNIKQRNYIRHLYEKNVQLLDVNDGTAFQSVPQSEVKSDLEQVVEQGAEEDAGHEETVPKYQGLLPQESKDRLFDQVKHVMDDMSIICKPDFSLQQLATLVGSNYKYVSQVVNERYGKSFKQVLNEQRVREACRILNDTQQSSHLTIEAIAANLGFNSRSNFTVTFKRITGISPSDFLKMAKEKKE
jgi:AraC-like DNA-binding protein